MREWKRANARRPPDAVPSTPLQLQKQCYDETDRIIDLREKLRHEVQLREQLDSRL